MTDMTIAHHIKGVRPALTVMQQLGFSPDQCLADTGINIDTLDRSDAAISLAQQETFYRNLLRLSGDPLVGLKLGEVYRLENYGVFGYAMLSSQTLRETAQLAVKFSALAFSLFKLSMTENDSIASLRFERHHPLSDELLQLFCDRDLVACWKGIGHALDEDIAPIRVLFMHDDVGRRAQYQRYFGCAVEFSQPYAELQFDASLLNTPMPRPDLETSLYCRAECQRMIAKLSQQSPFIDRVRELLVEQPGRFPNIETVAHRLNTSVRTLRRRLKTQDSNYQQLLDEIRYQLAQDYLANGLPVAQVAELLGYSENANFTHAFKRWSGVSPSHYRAESRQ